MATDWVATAVSVRLADDALRALDQLQSADLSRSAAIRQALVETAARRRRCHALAAEVAALEADEDDRREMRREMREVAALMESLRAAG